MGRMELGDPAVGLAIAVAIVFVLRDAARQVCRRLMDAVHLTLVDTAEDTLRHVGGIRDVTALRLRWIGTAPGLVDSRG